MAQHHFIPQMYLRGFASDDDPERIFFYDRRIADHGVTKRRIEDVCSQNNLYTLELKDGTKSDGLEQSFATVTEPIFKELIGKLTSRNALTAKEKSEFAACLATQMIRTPASREIYDTLSTAIMDAESKKLWTRLLNDDERKRAFEEFARETGRDASTITKEDIQGIIDGTKFKTSWKVYKESWLKDNIERMPDIFRALERMHWQVYFAPQGTSFITSDNPMGILVKNPDGYYVGTGILSIGAVRLFPLSKQACLSIMDDEPAGFSFVRADKERVKQINGVTAVSHHNILLGHNEQLVARSIKRSKGFNLTDAIKLRIIQDVKSGKMQEG